MVAPHRRLAKLINDVAETYVSHRKRDRMDEPTPDATGNGADPAREQMVAHVIENYEAYAKQLAAVNVLMQSLPLDLLAEANARIRPRSILLLPAGADQAAAQAVSERLRVDGLVIAAAISYVKAGAAAAAGGGL
jgi:hypothetical protein